MRGKPLGKNVLDEAAQELLAGKSHGALPAVMRVVLPSEGDVRVGDGEDAVIGDGDAVSIASQILQNVFGSAERRLGIDHPVLPKQGTQERRESLRVGQGKTFSVEGQLARCKQRGAIRQRTSHEKPG